MKWLWMGLLLVLLVGCEGGKKILDQAEEEPVAQEPGEIQEPVENPGTTEPDSAEEPGGEAPGGPGEVPGETPVSGPGIGPADPPYATAVTFPSGLQLDGLQSVSAMTATYPDPTGGQLPFASERQRHYVPVEYFIDIQALSAAQREEQVATNFKLNEYVWIPERNQDRYIYIDSEIAQHAQELRDGWGGPLVLTSTYRSPEYNAAINGAFFSRHMYGDAVDVKANNETMAFDLYNLAKFLEVSYLDAADRTIVGRNTPWIHIDDRGWPLNTPDTR